MFQLTTSDVYQLHVRLAYIEPPITVGVKYLPSSNGVEFSKSHYSVSP